VSSRFYGLKKTIITMECIHGYIPVATAAVCALLDGAGMSTFALDSSVIVVVVAVLFFFSKTRYAKEEEEEL
jgi:hypothetical protein